MKIAKHFLLAGMLFPVVASAVVESPEVRLAIYGTAIVALLCLLGVSFLPISTDNQRS